MIPRRERAERTCRLRRRGGLLVKPAVKVSADDIAQLLASSPPRRVPAHVEKAAQGGGGGCVAMGFGLFFGSFGMIFVFIFFPWRMADELRLSASGRTVPGEIRRVAETSMSINETKVREYAFAFTTAEGRPMEGLCYTTGRHWSEGAPVTVRYLRHRPEVACVEGARLSQGGWFGLFTVIFPLIGYGIAAGVWLGRRVTRRLLREGHMAEVDIVGVDETNMQSNYKTVYRITFSNPAAPGSPITLKRAHGAEVALALKHLREKQPVFILYDPKKPSRVIFPESLIDQE